MQGVFEKLYLSLGHILNSRLVFENMFPVEVVYENTDRQKEAYVHCKDA